MRKMAFLLLFATLLSLWLYPSVTPALGTASLLSSLAVSIQSIFEKHKHEENLPFGRLRVNSKIIREVVVLVFTILLVVLIGGIAGLLVGRVAGAYVEVRWQGFGMAAGFVSAILVSFVIGYTVRWGVGKLGKG